MHILHTVVTLRDPWLRTDWFWENPHPNSGIYGTISTDGCSGSKQGGARDSEMLCILGCVWGSHSQRGEGPPQVAKEFAPNIFRAILHQAPSGGRGFWNLFCLFIARCMLNFPLRPFIPQLQIYGQLRWAIPQRRLTSLCYYLTRSLMLWPGPDLTSLPNPCWETGLPKVLENFGNTASHCPNGEIIQHLQTLQCRKKAGYLVIKIVCCVSHSMW